MIVVCIIIANIDIVYVTIDICISPTFIFVELLILFSFLTLENQSLPPVNDKLLLFLHALLLEHVLHRACMGRHVFLCLVQQFESVLLVWVRGSLLPGVFRGVLAGGIWTEERQELCPKDGEGVLEEVFEPPDADEFGFVQGLGEGTVQKIEVKSVHPVVVEF